MSPPPGKYITTGTRLEGKHCTYEFYSNATHKTGRFFSPFYPQNYKPNGTCRYNFHALPGERVKIVFKNVQLHDTASSCRDSPDVIKVYDGLDASANVIGHLCGIHNDEEVISTGTNLYVAFTCDDKNQKQGEPPKFEFLFTMVKSTSNVSSSDQDCNQHIKSTEHRNGSISSPKYPFAYPADITCRYVFTGVGRERIQLRFLHMDLHFPRGDPTEPVDCGGSDSVTVYVIINGTTERIDTWCGKELPHMLMSSQHKMIVEFKSYHSSMEVTGFMAHYSFVTNFGILEGQQDNRGMCVFNYQSSVKSHGEITSPNYNGLYPRNTECHYLFYGKENERVRIEFVDFDIEGYMPRCDERSDYVSFSNFANSEDRKMTRLCGGPHNRVVWSDGPFFRVIFKSNECFDSTGFQAYYQFIASEQEKKDQDVQPLEEETYSVQGRRNSGIGSSVASAVNRRLESRFQSQLLSLSRSSVLWRTWEP
ncbi:hypothetical protein EGW08_001801 [Elysia chlorotica]|uniref:CUB domain-containing protein n=1 Tax=Elysia chlorotica TaxID=188477 RepID=A0A3S1CEG0_ELYCH|nr:hypothetical protein EGW08_001801 [Elysia chlorotica]